MTKYILNTGTRPRSSLKFPYALEIAEWEGSFTEASRNPVYYESAASTTGDLICFEITNDDTDVNAAVANGVSNATAYQLNTIAPTPAGTTLLSSHLFNLETTRENVIRCHKSMVSKDIEQSDADDQMGLLLSNFTIREPDLSVLGSSVDLSAYDYFVMINSDNFKTHHLAKITKLLTFDNSGDGFEFEPAMDNEITVNTKFRLFKGPLTTNTNTVAVGYGLLHDEEIQEPAVGLSGSGVDGDPSRHKEFTTISRPTIYFYNDRLTEKNKLDAGTKYRMNISEKTSSGITHTKLMFLTKKEAGTKIVDDGPYSTHGEIVDIMYNADYYDGFEVDATERGKLTHVKATKNFTVGGAAYNDDPTITHNATTALVVGMQVVGEGIPIGGTVTATDTISGGSGYSGASGVATTGGSGTGLTVNTTVSAGAVTAVAINNRGQNYTDNDTITISGGGGNATFKVNGVGGIPTIASVAGGSVTTFELSVSTFGGSKSSKTLTFITNDDLTDWNTFAVNGQRSTNGKNVATSGTFVGPARYLHYSESPIKTNVITSVTSLDVKKSYGNIGNMASVEAMDHKKSLSLKVKEEDPFKVYDDLQDIELTNDKDVVIYGDFAGSSGSTTLTVTKLEDGQDLRVLLKSGSNYESIKLGKYFYKPSAVAAPSGGSQTITVSHYRASASVGVYTAGNLQETYSAATAYRRRWSNVCENLIVDFTIDTDLTYTDLTVNHAVTSYISNGTTLTDNNGDADKTRSRIYGLELVLRDGEYSGERLIVSHGDKSNGVIYLTDASKTLYFQRGDAGNYLDYFEGDIKVQRKIHDGQVEEIKSETRDRATTLTFYGRDKIAKLIGPIVNKDYLFSQDYIYSTFGPMFDIVDTTVNFAEDVSLGEKTSIATSAGSSLNDGDILFDSNGNFIGVIDTISTNDITLTEGSYVAASSGDDIYRSSLTNNLFFGKAMGANPNTTNTVTSLRGTAGKGAVFTSGKELDSETGGAPKSSDVSDSYLSEASYLNDGTKLKRTDEETLGFFINSPQNLLHKGVTTSPDTDDISQDLDLAFFAKLGKEISGATFTTQKVHTVNSLSEYSILKNERKSDGGTTLTLAPNIPIVLGRIESNPYSTHYSGTFVRTSYHASTTKWNVIAGVPVTSAFTSSATVGSVDFLGPIYDDNENFIGNCIRVVHVFNDGAFSGSASPADQKYLNLIMDRRINHTISGGYIKYIPFAKTHQDAIYLNSSAGLPKGGALCLLESTKSSLGPIRQVLDSEDGSCLFKYDNLSRGKYGDLYYSKIKNYGFYDALRNNNYSFSKPKTHAYASLIAIKPGFKYNGTDKTFASKYNSTVTAASSVLKSFNRKNTPIFSKGAVSVRGSNFNDYSVFNESGTDFAGIYKIPKVTKDVSTFTVGGASYNDDPTITHTSTSLIAPGMGVSGTGIPGGSTVATVTDATHFELSASTTGGSLSGQTLTFTSSYYFGVQSYHFNKDGSTKTPEHGWNSILEIKDLFESIDPKATTNFLFSLTDLYPESMLRSNHIGKTSRAFTDYNLVLKNKVNDSESTLQHDNYSGKLPSPELSDTLEQTVSIDSASITTDQIKRFGLMRLVEATYDAHFNPINAENPPTAEQSLNQGAIDRYFTNQPIDLPNTILSATVNNRTISSIAVNASYTNSAVTRIATATMNASVDAEYEHQYAFTKYGDLIGLLKNASGSTIEIWPVGGATFYDLDYTGSVYFSRNVSGLFDLTADLIDTDDNSFTAQGGLFIYGDNVKDFDYGWLNPYDTDYSISGDAQRKSLPDFTKKKTSSLLLRYIEVDGSFTNQIAKENLVNDGKTTSAITRTRDVEYYGTFFNVYSHYNLHGNQVEGNRGINNLYAGGTAGGGYTAIESATRTYQEPSLIRAGILFDSDFASVTKEEQFGMPYKNIVLLFLKDVGNRLSSVNLMPNSGSKGGLRVLDGIIDVGSTFPIMVPTLPSANIGIDGESSIRTLSGSNAIELVKFPAGNYAIHTTTAKRRISENCFGAYTQLSDNNAGVYVLNVNSNVILIPQGTLYSAQQSSYVKNYYKVLETSILSNGLLTLHSNDLNTGALRTTNTSHNDWTSGNNASIFERGSLVVLMQDGSSNSAVARISNSSKLIFVTAGSGYSAAEVKLGIPVETNRTVKVASGDYNPVDADLYYARPGYQEFSATSLTTIKLSDTSGFTSTLLPNAHDNAIVAPMKYNKDGVNIPTVDEIIDKKTLAVNKLIFRDLDNNSTWMNGGTFTVGSASYNNDPTITHASSSAIVVSMAVSGSGIPAGATVASITDSTHFELSVSTTGGSKSGQTLTFTSGVIDINSPSSQTIKKLTILETDDSGDMRGNKWLNFVDLTGMYLVSEIGTTQGSSVTASNLFSASNAMYSTIGDTSEGIVRIVRDQTLVDKPEHPFNFFTIFDITNSAGAAAADTIVGGSGYSAGYNISTTGGSGTDLTVDIGVSGDAINSVTVNNKGKNYVDGETITVVGGSSGTFDINGIVANDQIELNISADNSIEFGIGKELFAASEDSTSVAAAVSLGYIKNIEDKSGRPSNVLLTMSATLAAKLPLVGMQLFVKTNTPVKNSLSPTLGTEDGELRDLEGIRPANIHYVVSHKIDTSSSALKHIIYIDNAGSISACNYRVMKPADTCTYSYSPLNIPLNILSRRTSKKPYLAEMYDDVGAIYFSDGLELDTTENNIANEGLLSMYVALDVDIATNYVVQRTLSDLFATSGKPFLDATQYSICKSDGVKTISDTMDVIAANNFYQLQFSNMENMAGLISIGETFTAITKDEINLSNIETASIGTTVNIAPEVENVVNNLFKKENIDYTSRTVDKAYFAGPKFLGGNSNLLSASNSILGNKGLEVIVDGQNISIVSEQEFDRATAINIDELDPSSQQITLASKEKNSFELFNEVIIYGRGFRIRKADNDSIEKKGKRTLERIDRTLVSKKEGDKLAGKLLRAHSTSNERLTIESNRTGIEFIKAGDFISIYYPSEGIERGNYIVTAIKYKLGNLISIELSSHHIGFGELFATNIIESRKTDTIFKENISTALEENVSLVDKFKLKELKLKVDKIVSTRALNYTGVAEKTTSGNKIPVTIDVSSTFIIGANIYTGAGTNLGVIGSITSSEITLTSNISTTLEKGELIYSSSEALTNLGFGSLLGFSTTLGFGISGGTSSFSTKTNLVNMDLAKGDIFE